MVPRPRRKASKASKEGVEWIEGRHRRHRRKAPKGSKEGIEAAVVRSPLAARQSVAHVTPNNEEREWAARCAGARGGVRACVVRLLARDRHRHTRLRRSTAPRPPLRRGSAFAAAAPPSAAAAPPSAAAAPPSPPRLRLRRFGSAFRRSSASRRVCAGAPSARSRRRGESPRSARRCHRGSSYIISEVIIFRRLHLRRRGSWYVIRGPRFVGLHRRRSSLLSPSLAFARLRSSSLIVRRAPARGSRVVATRAPPPHRIEPSDMAPAGARPPLRPPNSSRPRAPPRFDARRRGDAFVARPRVSP